MPGDFVPAQPLSPDSIRQAISAALGNDVEIPDGHRMANVVFANGSQIETALAVRALKEGTLTWDVDLVASHQWTGDHQNSFGVLSKFTW